MNNNHIIVVNAGSSSIKFAIFDLNAPLQKILYGVVENIQEIPVLKMFDQNNQLIKKAEFDQGSDYNFFFDLLFKTLESNEFGFNLVCAGHRVVHGGSDFIQPVFISDTIIQSLKKFIPFAPLHQPYNLDAIEIIARMNPKLPQIACFDTAFHTTHPATADRLGLPKIFADEKIKRYGFHGISYEFIVHQLRSFDALKPRVVIAHLGNGASMCAVKDGKAIDSTMGFTTLDGLLMGTRCGSLDPGVILYFLQAKNMSPDEIENMLYKQSGLLGVSGITSNMQRLLGSDDVHAKEAIDLFVYRIRKELGALAAALGGIDALVFTGGIGENAWQIREAVCRDSEWLGLELDLGLNKINQKVINQKDSVVDVYVIPTDEEWMIAKHCLGLITNKRKV
jgi:acetate kinase